MQQIKIKELIPHPRNNEFFDDMTDDKWTEFLESVRIRGVIEPVVITPDKVIVSGHQRVRACKELGIESVMCDVHTYDNEDQILQDLLETNIRQRGDVGGSAKKVGLRIKELERIYGIRNGSANEKGDNRIGDGQNVRHQVSQTDLANKLGMDDRTLRRYKQLANMIPELDTLVSTGTVTKTTALAIMKNLSETEQAELIASMDTTKRITQKQVDEQIAQFKKQINSRDCEIAGLNNVVDSLQKELDERPERVVEVTPDDYEELQRDVEASRKDYTRLYTQYNKKVQELWGLQDQLKAKQEKQPGTDYKAELERDVYYVRGFATTFLKNVGGYVFILDELDELSNKSRKELANVFASVGALAQKVISVVNEHGL